MALGRPSLNSSGGVDCAWPRRTGTAVQAAAAASSTSSTDLGYWSGDASDDPVTEAPGWDDWMDFPGIDRLLRRFAVLFD
jgi:hypothetical protein